MTAPLRIGILGAANIARLFIDGVRPSKNVVVTAVASRDAARAARFAAETGVEHVHASYDALLADPAIDAVYNPLPNSLHAAWSLRALDARKHVLCEKPLATSAADARAMFGAARRNGVHLVEGYPYRSQPQTLRMRALLADGAVGRLRYIHASFGFPLADPKNIRFDASLAGGALMDAGCYPLSLVRTVAGERATRVQATASWGESGVDLAVVASLEFASGVMAQIACSFVTARHRRAIIVGDAGTITTNYLNDTTAAMLGVLEVTRGVGWDAKRESFQNTDGSGFLAEAEAFARLVANGPDDWNGATPDESIDIAVMLEAIAASARSGAAVAIPPSPAAQ